MENSSPVFSTFYALGTKATVLLWTQIIMVWYIERSQTSEVWGYEIREITNVTNAGRQILLMKHWILFFKGLTPASFLVIAPQNNEKQMRQLSVIPPMMYDSEQRRVKFINMNGLMDDPMKVYKARQFMNVWTEHEREIFKEKWVIVAVLLTSEKCLGHHVSPWWSLDPQ